MKEFIQLLSVPLFLFGALTAILGFLGITMHENNEIVPCYDGSGNIIIGITCKPIDIIENYMHIIIYGGTVSAVGAVGLIYSTRKEQPKKKKGEAL